MTSREQVENIIFESIDEVNAMLPEDEHLTKSLETRLLGEGGQVGPASEHNTQASSSLPDLLNPPTPMYEGSSACCELLACAGIWLYHANVTTGKRHQLQ